MPSPSLEGSLVSLVESVRLSNEPERVEELAGRLPSPDAGRPISVTELLAPRRALWRRLKGPAPVAPERELRLELGRHWHRLLGDAVASEGALEARVRRGGVAGRIDLLADVPVEIKTARDAEPVEYPEQVEQLAVYCALVGQGSGRLVHVGLPEGAAPVVQVHDLRFRDLGRIDDEIGRRTEALRAALAAGVATGLGRCRWFGRGCEFQAAGTCDCRGDEPAAAESLAEEVGAREERPEIAARWTTLLGRRASEPGFDRPSLRYRDLLYPRRAYFRQVVGGPADAPPFRPPASPLDAYERTVASLESEGAGALHRLPLAPGAPDDEVVGWKGVPLLLRSTRRHGQLSLEELPRQSPQYLLELGFRCAAAGIGEGRLVVALEHPEPGHPPVQVVRADFGAHLAEFGRLAEQRRRGLAEAVERRAPASLAACPAWMAQDCRYRADCGCGEAPGRSQR